jgi:DNA-binding MarR family transcriptional regulator
MEKEPAAVLPTDDEEYFSLHMIMSQVMRLYFQRNYVLLDRLELHPGQVPVVMALSKNGGLSQRELSEKLTVRPSTVAVMLQRMERSGLVRRVPDEKDQRVSRVFLSEKGQTLLDRMREKMETLDQDCLKDFTSEEVALLKQFMNRVRENLTAACADVDLPCAALGRERRRPENRQPGIARDCSETRGETPC